VNLEAKLESASGYSGLGMIIYTGRKCMIKVFILQGICKQG